MTERLIILALCVFGSADERASDLAAQKEALQGTWRVYASYICGIKVPQDYQKSKVVFVFQGDKHWSGNETEGLFTKPVKYSVGWDGERRTIEVPPDADGHGGWEGYYYLEGDELTLQFVGGRDAPETRALAKKVGVEWRDFGYVFLTRREEEQKPAGKPVPAKASPTEPEQESGDAARSPVARGRDRTAPARRTKWTPPWRRRSRVCVPWFRRRPRDRGSLRARVCQP
jgi:uncharacterized protein (TIGR03067 family)